MMAKDLNLFLVHQLWLNSVPCIKKILTQKTSYTQSFDKDKLAVVCNHPPIQTQLQVQGSDL